MISAGMNVARLNMSHGDIESHAATLGRIRRAAEALHTTLAIMVDTRGREIRTGKLENGKLLLERKQRYSLFGDGRCGNETGVSVTHPGSFRAGQNRRPGVDR